MERIGSSAGVLVSGVLLFGIVTSVACSSAEEGSGRQLGPGPGVTGGAAASGGSAPIGTGGLDTASGGTVTGLGGGMGTAGTLDNACAKDTYEAEQRPLTLYTLFDDSGSMIPWWISVTQAFIEFTKDPASAGINVGIKYFGEACDAGFYATPDVPIDTLPGHAATIEMALGTHFPVSGTATTPALQGALQGAQQRQAQFPEEKVVILLVTDGIPSDCGADLNNASAAAKAAADAGVPVYALGLGNIIGLNMLSQAGGTGDALSADPTMVSLVVEAMNQIRGRALPCDYGLPEGGDARPGFINLVYDDGNGGGGTVPKVTDQGQCDGTRGGWYFNPDSTRLIACPETCTALKSGAAKAVNVVLGCPTVVLE